MKRRVVITGMGAITPLGCGVEKFWQAVRAGKTGFAPISTFDTAEYKCKLAAQVKDFQPENYMDRKAAKRMEAFSQFAVAAAGEAIEDAGLKLEEEDAAGWAALSAAESAACRQWKENTAGCWRRALQR